MDILSLTSLFLVEVQILLFCFSIFTKKQSIKLLQYAFYFFGFFSFFISLSIYFYTRQIKAIVDVYGVKMLLSGEYYLMFASISGMNFLSLLYSHNKISELNYFKVKKILAFNSIAILFSLGVCFSQNLGVMFLCYAGMALCFMNIFSYYNSLKVLRFLEKKYILSVIAPMFLLLLPGVFLSKILFGSLEFSLESSINVFEYPNLSGLCLAMLLFGIGYISLPPFSNWKLSFQNAPTSLSVFVNSVVVNTGFVMAIKVIKNFFGSQGSIFLTSSFFTGGWIVYVCYITAIYYALKALSMRNGDKFQLVTFSTISQVSYILPGLLLLSNESTAPASIWMFTHAFSKCAMIMILSSINSDLEPKNKEEYAYILRKTAYGPLFIFMGLSISGVFPLAGFYGKFYIFKLGLESNHLILSFIIFISALVNLIYIWPSFLNLFYKDKKVHKDNKKLINSINGYSLFAIWFCFSMVLLSSVYLTSSFLSTF